MDARRLRHAHAGRPVARRAPCRRPVPLPERPGPGPGDGHEHAAQRRLPRLRRAADRVRGRDPGQPDRRGARASRRPSSADAGPIARATSPPTGQVLRDERGAPRRSSSGPSRPPTSSAPRARTADGARAGRRGRAGRRRLPPRWPPASGSPSAGTAPASPGAARRPSPAWPAVELTADGRIRVLTASTEIGQGARTVFAQLVADALGVAARGGGDRAAGHLARPEQRPDGRLAHDDGRRRARASTRRAGSAAQVEARTGRPFAESYRDDARDHGAVPRRQVRFDGFPGIEWDDRTLPRRRLPGLQLGGRRGRASTSTSTPGRWPSARVVAVDDAGRIVNPVLAAGQVEGGTLQAVGYATIEEMKVEDGRYRQRPARHVPDPDRARRAADRDASSWRRRSPSAPHGAKGLGELPMDVRAPAVIAAIHDATGAWIHELPATPERVLAAILEAEAPDRGARRVRGDDGRCRGRPPAQRLHGRGARA